MVSPEPPTCAGYTAGRPDQTTRSSPRWWPARSSLTCSKGNGAIPLAEHAMMLMLMLNRDALRWLRAQQDRRWDHYSHGELNGLTCGIIGLGLLRRRPRTQGEGVPHARCSAYAGTFSRPTDVDEVVRTSRPAHDPAQGGLRGRHRAVHAGDPRHARRAGVPSDEAERLLHLLLPRRHRRRRRPAGRPSERAGSPAPASTRTVRSHCRPTARSGTAPNTIITPHNGATTAKTRQRGVDIFVDNLARFVAGRPLVNVVDKEAGY